MVGGYTSPGTAMHGLIYMVAVTQFLEQPTLLTIEFHTNSPIAKTGLGKTLNLLSVLENP